jgi:hypothetical protein
LPASKPSSSDGDKEKRRIPGETDKVATESLGKAHGRLVEKLKEEKHL